MRSDTLSWISVNIIGTVANVEVRERETKAPDEPTRPANLVAKKSGIIEEVRIYRGNVIVGAGQYVKEGELLVSGLFDSVQEGFRYTRASGKVYARTVEEFCIEIPYEYETKRYTGVEYCEKILNFFDFSMNISKKYGNEDILCDKINIVENYNLFGRVQTPFAVETVKYLEYETVFETRSAEAAEELAYFELDKKLSEMSEDSTLLKKTVTPLIRDDRFILHCVIVLIEDIAEVSEFDVVIDN
jgi:similar to stage IV sporulation protein